MVRAAAIISNTVIAFIFLTACVGAESANDRASIDAAVPLQWIGFAFPSGRLRLQGNAARRHHPYT